MGGSGRQLRELAAMCGIQSAFRDAQGRRKRAEDDVLLAALRAMGIIDHERESINAARRLHREREARLLEPVVVAWEGRGRFRLNARGQVRCSLELENGDVLEWKGEADSASLLPRRLPVGCHRLLCRAGRQSAEATVLSAPRQLPAQSARELGVFVPLYALRGEADRGAGDLADLRRFSEWASEHGCSMVGTLPLLAGFLDERPFDPSPYSPVSRLFWNELYLHLPEMRGKLPEGARQSVDYHAVMRAKRAALQKRAARAWENQAERDRIEAFIRERPETRDYAAFRAEVEARSATWQHWPKAQREGRLPKSDSPAARYHAYAQYLLDSQLRAISSGESAEVYLDLPIGVNGGGYDVWRFRDSFITDASTGAPPDALFEGGQDWGFPPPDPVRTRENGHAYFAASLRNHFRYAKVLRIDHVMGLHRLYWIPRGVEAKRGVYVRYPAEELYAVLSIEAHRAGARVIGENLGTVPEAVNTAMARHRVLGMFIGQFAMRTSRRSPMAEPPPGSLAALNTHDTPTFAGYVTGSEIDLRVEVGILQRDAAEAERRRRSELLRAMTAYATKRLGNGRGEAKLFTVLRALLRDLAASDAPLVLLALEDLWLEREPQNIPGVSEGYPCWRRRTRLSMQEFMGEPRIGSLLRELSQLREASRGNSNEGAAA